MPTRSPSSNQPAADPARVRTASRSLVAVDAAARTAALQAMADELDAHAAAILDANAADLADARGAGTTAALLDRLMLDRDRLAGVVAAVREVAGLPDPVGERVEGRELDNGLQLRKVRVPFGVVAVVYEARPNVTADAAAIAVRTGNGILLRGSTAARRTNAAMVDALRAGLVASGLDADAIMLYDPLDKDGFRELIATEGSVDLLIPRGGEGLKRFLLEHARVPVLAAAGGNCHVYVDASADPAMAERILLNAKTQRTGVCNAAETLLVHRDHAHGLLERLTRSLDAAGVRIHEDEEGWQTEYLDMDIGLRVVDSLEAAIDHVNRYGTGHSEAIITDDEAAAERFGREVDAACIYHNASTRFTDGGVFGMGAEVGISTNKLHVRGPIGPRELMTTRWLVRGSGQVRG